MKINITKSTLLEGIQVISAGVSARTTLPILHNFLMEAQNGKLKLVRTDMEMATVHFVPAEVEEKGSITIPLKEFSDIIKNLSDDKEINLTLDENNKFHIKSGKSKFWVMGTPKSEYPAIPEVERENSVELDPTQLARAIENCQGYFWGNSAYAVVFCICRDAYKMQPNKTAFEKMVEQLPYKGRRDYKCPLGTIANAFSDNLIFNENIHEWDQFNPLPRIVKLRDELRRELKL